MKISFNKIKESKLHIYSKALFEEINKCRYYSSEHILMI